jgi:ferric-dicitrate binding protein FerR (iron transport regulator)
LSVITKNQFPVEVTIKTAEKGRVILSNGTTKEFLTDQTTIKQTASGNLAINSDTIAVDADQTATALNQIIIPYGKRSEITLADGTHIWLNSGSQLSYPSKFKADSREVYLSGEAFFEVVPDPDKPFHVTTRDIRIEVLGTTFNVSSYAEDNTVQTVLLSGKVTASKNSLLARTIELAPGERLILDKTNSNLSKDKVDVQLYSSWVNGYLVFKNKPITEVYTKLKRFYNQNIMVEEGLGQITFSGKLDLGGNLKDVLDNIAFASSVNVVEDNGTFLIKR